MDYHLENKVAVIIGGSGGIGSVIAETLAAEGCSLILNGRNKRNISKISKFLKYKYPAIAVHTISSDAHNPTGARYIINKTLHYFNKIDILINCSSGPTAINKNSEDLSKKELEQALNNKLLGYIYTTNFALPIMKNNRRGRIVNIVGLAGKEPKNALLLSGIVNAALINFTKVIANEYSQYNIGVNAVNPGFIKTPRFSNYLKKQNLFRPQKTHKTLKQIMNSIPAKRLGTPQDVANLVTFLASEKSEYITGTTISIDGGLTHSAF